jgi:hypothetical protein
MQERVRLNILFMYRKAYFNANNLDYDVPSMAIFLL